MRTTTISTRPLYERIAGIAAALRSGQPVTIAELVARWDVCAKTIQRDLIFIRDRLGEPIAYDRRAHHWKRINKSPAEAGA